MKIGIIIGRIGGVDGVALETEKWIEVLHRMGHSIFILSGAFEERFTKGNASVQTLVPPAQRTLDELLYFFHPAIIEEQELAFSSENSSEEKLLTLLKSNTNQISKTITNWVEKNRLDLVISENASALPMHLSLGSAVKDSLEKLSLPVVTHDHDFWWERKGRYDTPYHRVRSMIEESFPLRLPHSRHAVINSAAKATLKEKYNREASVVPNVMDFNVPFGEKTESNRDFREELGFKTDDILLLQVTRVVRRKGIETALEVLKRLDDKRFQLLITGSDQDEPGGSYFTELSERASKLGISKQVHFVSDRVQNESYTNSKGKKVYSLSDAYAHGTAACYFSTYEGFGNAFVECVAARKPIFVNNYKPVYWPEIGSRGFKTVQIEDSIVNETALKEMYSILLDPILQRDIAEFNFELGKKYFSYEVLEEKLRILLRPINPPGLQPAAADPE